MDNCILSEIVISSNVEITQPSTGQSCCSRIDNMMTKTSEEVTVSNRLTGPKIPKVPPTFRQVKQNVECYDPTVVSIGPYHHGNQGLEAMEKLKVTLTCQFVEDSPTNYQDMYRQVKQVASGVKRRYMVEDTKVQQFSEEQFAEVMFIDGCFILQFLFCLLEQPEKLNMSNHDVVLIARDLFLLENQLPFEVLTKLMELRGFDDQKKTELFEAFFKHIRSMPRHRESCREKVSKNFKNIANLLFTFSKSKSTGNETSVYNLGNPAHLLELFHSWFASSNDAQDVSDRKSWYREDTKKTWSGRYYPAVELRNVGIHFKPSNDAHFTDVSFKHTLLAGRLYIPPLRIDDSTKPFLLNLVAYEACAGPPKDWVTSYVCFMDSLIDHHKDVKELRSKGVLISTLGSDKQVAELFNEISDYLVPNPYAYSKVKREIENHYKNGTKRWILHYKAPIYTFIIKYSFIYGLIVTAVKAYVSMVPSNPVFGVCKMPAANVTNY